MTPARWPEALPRPANRKLKQVTSVSPWFTAYSISDGVFALLEPNHDEEVISYLVIGSELAALVDTGMGIGNIRKEVEALTDRPVVVVNTHHHFDHTGDNHRFQEIWAFADPFEISGIERGHSRSACASYMSPGSYRNLPEGFDPDLYSIRPSTVTRRLEHLEVLELGDRTLEVHHCPGHSPGSICLLESRDRLLFTGDTVYPGTLIAHLAGADLEAYRRSLEHLCGLSDRVHRLCPAHNEAYIGKDLLPRVRDAFARIADGTARLETRGEIQVYELEGFRVTLPTLPSWRDVPSEAE